MQIFYTPEIAVNLELPEEEAGHCIRVLRLTAVSYTHLDVYKRQLLGYSVNGLAYWIMPCTSLRLFGRNSIAMQYSWGTSKGNSMPESMACL